MARTAKEIIADYESYRDSRASWLKDITADVDFFYGKQWTDDETQELKRRGQFPLVINRVYPIIMQEISTMNARNVEFRVLPRGDGDVKVAKVGNAILSYIQDRNEWTEKYTDILKSALVKGVGFALIYADLVSDDSPEVGIEHIPTEWVYIDPESRRKDLYDADKIYISRMVTKAVFLRLYPDREDIWNNTQQEFDEAYTKTNLSDTLGIVRPGDIYDANRKKIRILEEYSLEKEPRIKRTNRTNGAIKYYTEEEWASIKTDPVVAKAIQLGTYSVKKVWVDVPYITIVAGTRIVKEKTKLPGTKMPIVAFFNIHTETPYALGEVRMLKDLNREINKRRSLMIQHAQMSTSAPWWVQKGSVDDIEDMERRAARASSILEYNPGMEKPTRDNPVPLPNALYTLEATAKHDIEYTAGIFALSQGDASQAPETYSATLAIEEFGNRRIQLKQRSINAALSRLGQIAWEYMQFLYDDNKILRISQEDGTEIELQLNMIEHIDAETVRKVMDVSTGFYDVKAVAGSTLASNRWAELQEYKELLQIGAIDLEEFLKKVDIFDREGILKRKSQLLQLQSQAEQLTQALEEYDKALNQAKSQIQQLDREVVKLRYELQTAKKAGKE